MKKSQRLNVIAELNEKNEKATLKELGHIQQQCQEAETQLENLKEYRQDYESKYQSIAKLGANIKQLLEFRAFMSKLDQAIEEQQQVILNVEKQLNSKRSQWEQQHQKTKSMQKVVAAAVKVELKAEDKREQNEQDDRATRIGRNGGTRSA